MECFLITQMQEIPFAKRLVRNCFVVYTQHLEETFVLPIQQSSTTSSSSSSSSIDEAGGTLLLLASTNTRVEEQMHSEQEARWAYRLKGPCHSLTVSFFDSSIHSFNPSLTHFIHSLHTLSHTSIDRCITHTTPSHPLNL